MFGVECGEIGGEVMGNLKLKMMTVFCGIAIFLSDVHASPLYEHVAKAQVNSLELTQPHSFSAVQKAFGKPIQQPKLVFSECTANHDADVSYADKTVRMEYFSEDNEAVAKQHVNNAAYQAVLWLDWQNMALFKDRFVVGSLTVSSELTLEQFKKVFPLSAQHPLPNEEGNESMYIVLLGDDVQNEDVAYRPTIRFVFKRNRLLNLSVDQGIAC
jgi:hypothetical protein